MRTPVLKWKLDLQERQRVADGAGGFVETWATLGAVWADVEARGVSDGGVTGGDSSRIRYRITLRAVPEADPACPRIGQRLVTGSRAFVVDGVSERDADGIWLTVWAREEVLA